MLTIKQLQVFVTVAKTSTVSNAAEKLFLSQSAVSMALTNLEQQLGVNLFDRLGKRLYLNNSGKAFLHKASMLLETTKELSSFFKNEVISGTVTMAASLTIGNYLLPCKIATFKKEYPNVNTVLQIENSNEIIKKILEFKIDIGYIEGICNHPEIKVVPIFKDELIIFARKNHPLSRQRLNYNHLSKVPWIMREIGSGTRLFVEFAINKHINKVPVFLVLNHSEAIKQAVIHSDAISCLSSLCVKDEIKAGKLVKLQFPPLQLKRNFLLAIHKDKYKTNALNKWIEAMK